MDVLQSSRSTPVSTGGSTPTALGGLRRLQPAPEADSPSFLRTPSELLRNSSSKLSASSTVSSPLIESCSV